MIQSFNSVVQFMSGTKRLRLHDNSFLRCRPSEPNNGASRSILRLGGKCPNRVLFPGDFIFFYHVILLSPDDNFSPSVRRSPATVSESLDCWQLLIEVVELAQGSLRGLTNVWNPLLCSTIDEAFSFVKWVPDGCHLPSASLNFVAL